MIKKFYLFSLVLLTLFFVSCSETEEVGRYDNWQSRNEAFIDSIANVYDSAPDHGGLKRLDLISAPGDYIYYKVKESASSENVTSPHYTDYAKVHYKGTNILNEYFDGTFTGTDPIDNGTDTSQGDSTPTTFQVSGVITGWTEALQKMKKGDRWVVYIPWKYGYGSGGSGSTILGYSTLIFDIKLLDFASTENELKN